MKRLAGAAAGVALALLAPATASGQVLRVAAFGVAATNAEVEDTRQARGLGFGLGAEAQWRRVQVDARYMHAALLADYSLQPDYNVDQLDLAATWFWRPYLAPQIGLTRRFVTPEFVAQEVGFARIGVLSQVRLARVAGLWVKGSYLPFSRFSGGGSAGLGLEVSLGVEVGDRAGRFLGFGAFDYQRIDREAAAEAPLQFSAGQVGIKLRL